MRMNEQKVRLAASIVSDRFGKKALGEIWRRVDEARDNGEPDTAAFWQEVGEAIRPPAGMNFQSQARRRPETA